MKIFISSVASFIGFHFYRKIRHRILLQEIKRVFSRHSYHWWFDYGIGEQDNQYGFRFHQANSFRSIFRHLADRGIYINRSRIDYGSFSQYIIMMIHGYSTSFTSCHPNMNLCIKTWQYYRLDNRRNQYRILPSQFPSLYFFVWNKNTNA